MKQVLALCLAISFVATVTEASRHPSSAPRSFKAFLEAKIRRISDAVLDLKQEVENCCNKAACPYGGESHDHGSVFVAEDGCNICVCKHGSVNCTSSTACDQSTAGSSYNYRDEIAQAYCATRSITTGTDPKHVSAVRRDCDDPGAANTCDALCGIGSTFASSVTASFPSENLDEFNCVGALWVWNDHPVLPPNPGPGQTGTGQLNLVTISWDEATGCGQTDCGPNYCCCEAVYD